MQTKPRLHAQNPRKVDFSVIDNLNVLVSGLFSPVTQTPTCFTIRTFASPVTETPVYLLLRHRVPFVRETASVDLSVGRVGVAVRIVRKRPFGWEIRSLVKRTKCRGTTFERLCQPTKARFNDINKCISSTLQ